MIKSEYLPDILMINLSKEDIEAVNLAMKKRNEKLENEKCNGIKTNKRCVPEPIIIYKKP